MKRWIFSLLCLALFTTPALATTFNPWVPQGVQIPVASGNTFSNPNVIRFATGCTLVSSPCYKIWCNVYNFQGTQGVYYYESPTGLAPWTAASTSVPDLSGYQYITVWYIGTTYYLFGNTATGTNIDEFTSLDGRTWTLAKLASIPLGGNGTYDHLGAYQPNLIDVIGGVYYAYYSARAAFAPTASLALVTSTDLINWTKYAGNPFPAFFGGAATFHYQPVGGLYYAWQSSRYVNSKLNTANSESIVRFSAPSVTGPWTKLTLNGEQVATYYAASPADFNVSGTTFVPNSTATDQQLVATPGGNIIMYYTNAPNGIPTGICAALATGITFNELVQTYEGVQNAPISGNAQLNLVPLASDNFQRADGGLGANWSPIATSGNYSAAQISSHLVERNATADGDSYYNAQAWNAQQWSASTISAINAANAGGGAAVLMNKSGTASEYTFQWNGILGNTGTTFAIKKIVAGTATVLISNNTFITLSAGDVIMGVAFNTGTATRLLFYWNGYCIGATDDTTFSSGAAGFQVAANTNASDTQISAWSGGSFQTAPLLVGASLGGKAAIGGKAVVGK